MKEKKQGRFCEVNKKYQKLAQIAGQLHSATALVSFILFLELVCRPQMSFWITPGLQRQWLDLEKLSYNHCL